MYSAILKFLQRNITVTFLTVETQFDHFLAVLENFVLHIGLDSAQATLNVMSGLLISEKTSLIRNRKEHRLTFGEGRYAT